MEVPIAGMAIGGYNQAVSLGNLLNPHQELRYFRNRNRDIIQDKTGTDPGQGSVSGLTSLPELQPFLLVLSRPDQAGVILLENAEDHLHLCLHLFPGETVRLRQDHHLCFGKIDVGVLLNGFQGRPIQDFHDAGENSTGHGLGDGFSRIFKAVEGCNRGHGIAGNGVNFQGYLGDHP